MPGLSRSAEIVTVVSGEKSKLTSRWCKNGHDKSQPGAVYIFATKRKDINGQVYDRLEVHCSRCCAGHRKGHWRRKHPDARKKRWKLPGNEVMRKLLQWDGWSMRQVAEKYGCSVSSVQHLCKRQGIKVKWRSCKKDHQCKVVVGPKGKRCEGVCVRVRVKRGDKVHWWYQTRCAEHYQLYNREKSARWYERRRSKGGTRWRDNSRHKFIKPLGTSKLIHIDDRVEG